MKPSLKYIEEQEPTLLLKDPEVYVGERIALKQTSIAFSDGQPLQWTIPDPPPHRARCVGSLIGYIVLLVFVTACAFLIYNIIKSRMYADV